MPSPYHGLNDDETVSVPAPVTDSEVFDNAIDEAASDEQAQQETRTIRRPQDRDTTTEHRQVCAPSLWVMVLYFLRRAWAWLRNEWKHYALAFLVGSLLAIGVSLMCMGALHLIGMALGWDGSPR